MSSMKKTKEGINLKELLRLKNTGSIFVIAGLLQIICVRRYYPNHQKSRNHKDRP